MKNDSMLRWIKSYESRRTSRGRGRYQKTRKAVIRGLEINGERIFSNKFDWWSKDWFTIRDTPIPELDGRTMGQICHALISTWRNYKMSLQEGGHNAEAAYRINQYEFFLGVEPLTEFREAPEGWNAWVKHQLRLESGDNFVEPITSDEAELKFEEEISRREDLENMGLADPQEEMIEEEPLGGRKLYNQLLQEEAQDMLEQQQQEAESDELQQDDETDVWDEESEATEIAQVDDDW